jgi:hypothetical protein
MEKKVAIFHSLKDADDADIAYYAALTPEERLTILLELISRHGEMCGDAAEGFERVHRVVELSQS